MPRDEFLHAVDAALLHDEIARGSFHQYREVAPCNHRNIYGADVHAEDFLVRGVERQAFHLREIAALRAMQMHDQFQVLLAPHRRFAEHGADVQYSQTAHFEKVAQQLGTASFQRIRCDAVQFDDVVGNQPIAARDQLQSQFAFTDRAFAGNDHADTQHIKKHAMARGRFGQFLGKIVANQPHQVHAWFGRTE